MIKLARIGLPLLSKELLAPNVWLGRSQDLQQGRTGSDFSKSSTVALPIQEEAFQWYSVGEAFVIITHAVLFHREYGRLPSHGCAQNPSKQEFPLVLFKYCFHLAYLHTTSYFLGQIFHCNKARSVFLMACWVLVKAEMYYKLLLTTLKLPHQPW